MQYNFYFLINYFETNSNFMYKNIKIFIGFLINVIMPLKKIICIISLIVKLLK
jgi:hypothetical protein